MKKGEIINALKWRYTVKKFDSTKKISPENLKTIEDSLVLTASSWGLQPWKFIIVEDKKMREKLLQETFLQTQVVECSHLIVITTKTQMDEKYIDFTINEWMNIRHEHDTDEVVPIAAGFNSDQKPHWASFKAYRDLMVKCLVEDKTFNIPSWASRQGYIALGNLLTTLSLLKIDGTPIEGFSPAGYNKVLGLENTGYTTTLVCPIGYRAEDDKYSKKPKFRFSKDFLIKHI